MELLNHSLPQKMMAVDCAYEEVQAMKKHLCNCKEDWSNIILHITASNSLNECIDCIVTHNGSHYFEFSQLLDQINLY
jgi:archaellum component FlaF (FlaF/FlaG flagellin family)